MAIELMTMQQICDYMQVSERTIRRCIEDGRLAVVRVRGGIRFRPSDVQRFIDSTEEDHGTRQWPDDDQWPQVIATAEDLMQRLNASVEELEIIISEWAAMPPSDHRWLDYGLQVVQRVRDVLRPQIEPWTKRQEKTGALVFVDPPDTSV